MKRIDIIFCAYITTGPQTHQLARFLEVPYGMVTYGKEVWGEVPQSQLQALQGAQLVTSVSMFTARYVVKNGVEPTRVIEIPGHVDIDRFRPLCPIECRRELGVEGKRVLLTVARLSADDRRKGYDTVVQALPLILEVVPDVIFIIVGDGTDRGRVERLVENMQLSNVVRFAGEVDDDLLIKYYNACDLFIMPSKLEIGHGRYQGEGFGIVYIEANACGKPVIGGWGGGVPEAVEHGVTGLLVDPNSIDGVAQAAIRLLSDKEYARKLGEQGRQRTVDRFSLEQLDREVDRLLDRSAEIVKGYRPMTAWEFIRKML